MEMENFVLEDVERFEKGVMLSMGLMSSFYPKNDVTFKIIIGFWMDYS
jgi:hypothetical protein